MSAVDIAEAYVMLALVDHVVDGFVELDPGNFTRLLTEQLTIGDLG